MSEAEALTQAEREELDTLRLMKREIWSNPERWAKWCDERLLDEIEALRQEKAKKHE